MKKILLAGLVFASSFAHAWLASKKAQRWGLLRESFAAAEAEAVRANSRW